MNEVFDVTNFLEKHPGGNFTLLSVVSKIYKLI